MMAFSLSSCSSSLSSALETKPKSIGRRKAKLSVRTRAAKADDVTRDLKTSRTTITTTTVALLTAFVVALSSSAPEHAAKADGQVFGLSPKVLAPGINRRAPRTNLFGGHHARRRTNRPAQGERKLFGRV